MNSTCEKKDKSLLLTLYNVRAEFSKPNMSLINFT